MRETTVVVPCAEITVSESFVVTVDVPSPAPPAAPLPPFPPPFPPPQEQVEDALPWLIMSGVALVLVVTTACCCWFCCFVPSQSECKKPPVWVHHPHHGERIINVRHHPYSHRQRHRMRHGPQHGHYEQLDPDDPHVDHRPPMRRAAY